jgi:CBS domain-containing protein
MQLTDTIRAVLRNKHREIWAVEPETTVYDALALMADKEVGALLVMSEEGLVGVVSERDYARKVILLGKTSRETQVEEIMRPAEFAVTPEHRVEEAMRMMTQHRTRHVPVLENGRVIGVVSIGDLVNWVINAQENTINQLHAYMAGNYPG